LPTAAPFVAAAASGEEPHTFAETSPLAIVVVDDDALVLMTTCSLLQDLGHQVFDAKSAGEALAIIEREQSVSLVITDYSMPEMDGVALARAITASRPDLPVIVATGYPTLPAAADLDGPRLVKPFRQDELARAIAVAVAGASGGQRPRLAEVVN
jgi:CheY-like chemotaxis protein